MKAFTKVLLGVMSLVCVGATVALVGCSDKDECKHQWEGVVIKEATCTEKGLTTDVCALCGDDFSKILPALGHDYVGNTCQRCGDEGMLEFSLNADGETYSVTGIGNCTDTDIVIPAVYNKKPVTSIGGRAFSTCRSLTSVVIPDSITSIGDSAFSTCRSLTSVVIPDSIMSIGDFVFSNCYSLTSVVIGDSVTSIGTGAFYFCESLTSVVIGDSVTSIGAQAFYSCESLTSVVIGDSVTSVGVWGFFGCRSLTSVYYKGDASDWNGIKWGNDYLTSATRYYYSESQPTTSGRYWHYDENGKVVMW